MIKITIFNEPRIKLLSILIKNTKIVYRINKTKTQK